MPALHNDLCMLGVLSRCAGKRQAGIHDIYQAWRMQLGRWHVLTAYSKLNCARPQACSWALDKGRGLCPSHSR